MVSFLLGNWCLKGQCICRICYISSHAREKKKNLLSHYEFRNKIALAWLDSKEHWPNRDVKSFVKKRSAASISSSIESERQTRSSTKPTPEPMQKRAKKLTDYSLDPNEGALKCRLDHTVSHWPLPPCGKKVKCALHFWAAGIEDRAQIVKCSLCEVHLCVSCFQIFHVTHSLLDAKDNLFGEFIDKKMEALPRTPKEDEIGFF